MALILMKYEEFNSNYDKKETEKLRSVEDTEKKQEELQDQLLKQK